jgi:hypothetical protein
VFLTTLSGERIEYEGIKPTPEGYKVDPSEGMNTKNGKEGCGISDDYRGLRNARDTIYFG